MAELVHLKGFDRSLKGFEQEVRSLQTLLATEPKTWSTQQAVHIRKLVNAMVHLDHALTELVHNNREH